MKEILYFCENNIRNMYLNETEEILAIIVCVAIVIGFIFKTIQDVKSTVAEEKVNSIRKKTKKST